MLPFSREEFLSVFQRYNEEVWPLQFGLLLLAVVATGLAVRGTALASGLAAAALAALWLWVAITYHWLFFTAINPAAWLFGLLFVAQGWLFGRAAVRGELSFGRRRGPSAWMGAALVGYALIVYPMLAQSSDHPYPRSPTFGLPCPTTVFTLGLLLLTNRRVPARLLVIPVLWAAVGTFASFALAIREDLGLGIAAVATICVLALRSRTTPDGRAHGPQRGRCRANDGHMRSNHAACPAADG